MNRGHAAASVATEITTRLQLFSIDVHTMLISAISDTTASALAVADELDTSDDIDFEGQRCSMHTGDLVMAYACGLKCRSQRGVEQNSFSEGKSLVAKLQAIASHFSRSSKDYEKLKEVAKANGIPFVTLKPRQDTRMASTYNLIASVIRMKFALEVFFSLGNGDATLRQQQISGSDWQFLVEMEGVYF